MVAVPGVLACWASSIAATYAFSTVDATAGYVLLPSAVWIGIASVLVYSIWELNGKQPMVPTLPSRQ